MLTTNPGYEEKDINLKKTFWIGGLSVLAIIIVLIYIIDYYDQLHQQVYYDQVLKPQSEYLIKLDIRENEELNSYGIIDSVENIYHIPIDSAMKLMVEEQSAK